MVSLAVFWAALSNEPDATYQFRLLSTKPPRVEVELRVAGDADGESSFSARTDWGGIDHCERFLHELAFIDANGAALAATQPDATRWIVRHAPSAPIVARWHFDPPPPWPANASGNDYRPQLSENLMHVIGETALLKPDALEDRANHSLRVEWRGFADAKWSVASSFGDDPAGTTVERKLDDFLHAVFIAGRELHLQHADVRGKELLVALAGDGYGFSGEQFVALAAKLVAAERAFFDDWADPRFVITCIPNGVRSSGNVSLGGTGLTDSFAMFVSLGLDLKPGSDDARRLEHTLAHEYFHRWNGLAYAMEPPEGTGYWFSEGFTDFFARRLLLRSGVWDAAAYVADLNESLANYFTSPVKNAPASRIVAEFWKSRDVGALPYRRGDLVALMLDHEIRATSGGKQSLDDFMREAIARGRGGESLSTANLMELVADYTSQEFAERIRAIVVDGATVELDDATLSPWLTLSQRRTRRNGAEVALPVFEVAPELDAKTAAAHL